MSLVETYAPAAQVESVFAPAVREINTLETRIAQSEDDADAKLWQQAEIVVAQLAAGMTQRALAAQWINARTGDPYSAMHVNYVSQVVKLTLQTPRPRFRDAYNEIANKKSAHVAHNSGNNEWYTPAPIVEAARRVMGAIDCDPASSARANGTVQATRFYTEAENGLDKPWGERVWMNPPYAQPLIGQFVGGLLTRLELGEVLQACVLVNNGTDTEWGQDLLRASEAVCFPKGRIRFIDAEGQPSGAPLQGQMVCYAGSDSESFAEVFADLGSVWRRHGRR